VNQPREHSSIVVLSEDDLLHLARDALQAEGVPEADAISAARILVLADLFGVSTHGVDRIPAYSNRLRIGGINATPSIDIKRVSPSLIRIDGDNGLGPVIGLEALRAAMDAATETGVAMAFVRGSNHFGPIMPYAYLACERGFASVIASNATTTIAPSGGRESRLGNNPLGMGVPNPGGDPIILDMAMSVVARAKIRLAAQKGEAIPATWATDRDGRATTDPNAALSGFLSPIGGYKGYGLALMVDLFAGLLSDAAYLTHVSSWADAPEAPQNLGHFFLVIDTKRLGSTEWLHAAMSDFRSILVETPATDPDQPVRVPGETEMKGLHERKRNGIGIPRELHAVLVDLADRRS
jgi:LDH2 family malate/lactate/ureidoglycolate dehydrogenase